MLAISPENLFDRPQVRALSIIRGEMDRDNSAAQARRTETINIYSTQRPPWQPGQARDDVGMIQMPLTREAVSEYKVPWDKLAIILTAMAYVRRTGNGIAATAYADTRIEVEPTGLADHPTIVVENLPIVVAHLFSSTVGQAAVETVSNAGFMLPGGKIIVRTYNNESDGTTTHMATVSLIEYPIPPRAWLMGE